MLHFGGKTAPQGVHGDDPCDPSAGGGGARAGGPRGGDLGRKRSTSFWGQFGVMAGGFWSPLWVRFGARRWRREVSERRRASSLAHILNKKKYFFFCSKQRSLLDRFGADAVPKHISKRQHRRDWRPRSGHCSTASAPRGANGNRRGSQRELTQNQRGSTPNQRGPTQSQMGSTPNQMGADMKPKGPRRRTKWDRHQTKGDRHKTKGTRRRTK